MPRTVDQTMAVRLAYDRVRSLYGSAIGTRSEDVVTPALLLDFPATRRNITKMASRLANTDVDLRPHVKVHKSPDLARMQVEAGAIGVSTATVWEAIVMASAGVDHVFVANTVAGQAKIAALADLASEAEVMVAVDNAANAADLAAAADAVGTTLNILIEIDTGMDRAGVDDVAEALALADAVEEQGSLRLQGVTGYEGHCSLTPDRPLRHQRQQEAMAFLAAAAEELRRAGHPCPIVSAGGTATLEWAASSPGVTESQAGSYVLMDIFHASMVNEFEFALTVNSTVISRTHDRVIIDAGSKSIGSAELATMRDVELPSHRFDEEHGIFVATPNSPLKVGDTVELIPGYAPSTVNLYDAYHVTEDGRVVDIWPIVPRGPGHCGLLLT